MSIDMSVLIGLSIMLIALQIVYIVYKIVDKCSS